MTPRKPLLTSVFRNLQEHGVDYCVSRNHTTVFEDSSSDVDLLVRPGDLDNAERRVKEAADACGFSCVLRTRFANLCLLFWKAPHDFLRIDFETELRWRIFPVQDAERILSTAIPSQGFKIPSAAGEAAIIVTKSVWMGRLSERYRKRLSALMGTNREGIIRETSLPAEWFEAAEQDRVGKLRKKLVRRTLASPALLARAFRYSLRDLRRFLQRAFQPPGILLSMQGIKEFDSETFGQTMEMAFPSAKTCVATSQTGFKNAFLTVFRGGMLITGQQGGDETTHRKDDSAKHFPKLLRAGHRFRCVGLQENESFLIHEGSGRMTGGDHSENSPEQRLPSFIGETLAMDMRSKGHAEPGKFVVLVGLDGAGKTTFARGVAEKIAEQTRYRGIRYFHWIPRLTGFDYPLPSLSETPRKDPETGAVARIASVIRLGKNVIAARLSYHLRVRPLVKRGYLVLVDRFVYNYWIDPVSLRYSGPDWCLRLAAFLFPKPDLVLSLEAEPEVLLSRKKELTRDQMVAMRHRIHSVPARPGTLKVLDASRSPQDLVSEFHAL